MQIENWTDLGELIQTTIDCAEENARLQTLLPVYVSYTSLPDTHPARPVLQAALKSNLQNTGESWDELLARLPREPDPTAALLMELCEDTHLFEGPHYLNRSRQYAAAIEAFKAGAPTYVLTD